MKSKSTSDTGIKPVFTLVWTETFVRTAKKIFRRHPDLTGDFEIILKQLEQEPRTPHLKFYALQGKHKGKYAVSLTYAYRIVFILRITAKEVVLLDIGSHDEVYRD